MSTGEAAQTRGGTAVTFKEVLAQVIEWLQQDKRLSYRALKRQFALGDDAYLDDLKEALLYTHALGDRGRRSRFGLDGRPLPPPPARLRPRCGISTRGERGPPTAGLHKLGRIHPCH